MENLNYNDKLAILRILKDIINADNIVHEREIEYLNHIMESLHLDESSLNEADNLNRDEALVAISHLDPETLQEIAKMMGQMIVVDNDINYNEIQIYQSVCEACGMNEEFAPEDYPEYTLSGDFPEDFE